MDNTWRESARRKLSRNRIVFLWGMLFTFMLAAVYITYPDLRHYLENKVYDLLLRPKAVRPAPTTPVIVDIDEKSLARYGQWPWPRYRIARLLDKIQSAGAAAVGLDILFVEADRTSLKTIQQHLAQEFNADLQFSGIPEAMTDNDGMLAKTLARGPHILGFKFNFQGGLPETRDCRLHPLNLVVAHGTGVPENTPLLLSASGMTCPLPRLAAQARSSGFINATPDRDGILRRLPLVIRHGRQFYPSLALAALFQTHGISQALLVVEQGNVRYLQAGEFRIPLDAQGNLLLRYRRGAPGFSYISAADLLADALDSEALAGRIVFVGTSAAGLEDHRVTPVAAIFHGVEAHATVVDNIQQGDLLSRPLWVPGLELAMILISGLLTTLLLFLGHTLLSTLLLAGWSAAVWGGADWSLNRAGVFVAPIFPLLAVAINFALLTLFKFIYEERKARKRTLELVMAQEFTLQSLASLAETRDQETGGHIHRVQRYVRALCDHLKHLAKYRDFLDEGTIDLLYKSAPLHDIGKVGVPDRILRKEGKLTEDEYEEMKKHTIYGLQAIEKAEGHFDSGSVSRFLRFAKDFTYTHHERWDGKGYPRGVAGEAIPIAGRLMSLADVYDALVSRRIYKPAFSHEKAVGIIMEGKGTLFDPELIETFLSVEAQFNQIALELADESARHPEDPERLMRQPAGG
ncbi:MAG: CHASE2 domain-containing protein [Desulfobacterales bacterium]